MQQKKFRKEEQLFIAEGEKIAWELLQSPFHIHAVYAIGSWLEEHALITKRIKERVFEITEEELKKISLLSTPNKIIVIARIPEPKVAYPEIKDELLLVLDNINDPGNLGTLIRIADWFGVHTIICSEDTVDAYNPKTVQAAMGSLFRVNMVYENLIDWVVNYKSETANQVYGTLLKGAPVYDQPLNDKGLIIIGNESKGIRLDLMDVIDKKISIPSYPSNKAGAESLNAAVAAAVILSEFRRRKGK